MNTKCQESIKDTITITTPNTFTPSNISTTNLTTISSQINFTLNSIPESIIIISEKGKIIETNLAASRLFGWTKDEIINKKDINYILSSRDGEKLLELLKNDLTSLLESSQYLHGVKKNGSTFPCEVTFGIFPKILLNNISSVIVNTPIIAVFNINKRSRLSDSVSLNLQSRYQKEYEEIKSLGKGGFGSVYKARNRLDGQLYAIKKIKLQSKPKEFDNSYDLEDIVNPKDIGSKTTDLSFLSAEDIRIVREVKTFARISNHPNIVRYHGSWIEVEERCPKIKNKKRNEDDDEDDEDDDNSEESNEESNEEDDEYEEDDDDYQNDSSDDSHEEGFNNYHYIGESNSNSNSNKNQNHECDFVISFEDDVETPITTQTKIKTKDNGYSNENQDSDGYFIDINISNKSFSKRNDNKNQQTLMDSSYIDSNKNKNKQTIEEDSSYFDYKNQQTLEEDSSYIEFATTNTNSNNSINKNFSSINNTNFEFKRNKENNLFKQKILPKKINTKFLKPSYTNYNKKRNNNKIDNNIKNSSHIKKNSNKNNKKNKLSMYLLIQMELCSGQTLENWISKRNQSQFTDKKEIIVDRKLVFKIFKQVVQAIAHVHWNGCIHRDIKPANVFFQDDDHILLGDFGLAKDVDLTTSTSSSPNGSSSSSFISTTTTSTTLSSSTPTCYSKNISPDALSGSTLEQKEEGEKRKDGEDCSQHEITSGVGTYIYASPEQLASLHGYDNKTDIYSLGILLFELLWPFKTGMERIHTLTNLRKGIFPDNFVEKWPLELPLLRSLLNPNPAQRPTAQEILDSEVLNTSYITPLYNNPTNLLSALDLRVTREPVEPEIVRSSSINKCNHSLSRNNHCKTQSTASKYMKSFQYGDCGACRQKDMAITSFRSQFLKTKNKINLLESTVIKVSHKVWIMSIIMFILGSLITLAVVFTFYNPGRTYYYAPTNNLDNQFNNTLENNVKNIEIQSMPFENTSPTPSVLKNEYSYTPTEYMNGSTIPTPESAIEKKESQILNNDLSQQEPFIENINNGNSKSISNGYLDKRKVVASHTISLNYNYNSQTVTLTRTVHIFSKTTNLQDTTTPVLN